MSKLDIAKTRFCTVDDVTERWLGLGSGIWNLESGIWNLESGIWNLESGIWNLESGIWNIWIFCPSLFIHCPHQFIQRSSWQFSSRNSSTLLPHLRQYPTERCAISKLCQKWNEIVSYIAQQFPTPRAELLWPVSLFKYQVCDDRSCITPLKKIMELIYCWSSNKFRIQRISKRDFQRAVFWIGYPTVKGHIKKSWKIMSHNDPDSIN